MCLPATTASGPSVRSWSPATGRQARVWTEQQKLTASDAMAGDQFAFSMGLSGSTLVLGASMDDVGANINQGSAYVFKRQGGFWSEQQKLTASDGAAADQFGNNTRTDGRRIIVSAPLDDGTGGADQGAAYVFRRQGGFWSEEQKLTAS